MLGVEKSFLEAEYHCHDGYRLIKKFKRKTFIKNKNLICKKRRWFGQRPLCKQIKSKLKHKAVTTLMEQQCDIHEAKKCDQLCIKRENSSDTTCYCHKGFRLIGTRCLGEQIKNIFIVLLLTFTKIMKNICSCSHPVPEQILMNVKMIPMCAEMENVSIRPDPSIVFVKTASG